MAVDIASIRVDADCVRVKWVSWGFSGAKTAVWVDAQWPAVSSETCSVRQVSSFASCLRLGMECLDRVQDVVDVGYVL